MGTTTITDDTEDEDLVHPVCIVFEALKEARSECTNKCLREFVCESICVLLCSSIFVTDSLLVTA